MTPGSVPPTERRSPPTSAAGRVVTGKADLRLGDTVRDPIGQTIGRVVDLNPIGWVDDPNERVTVQWRWAGWRSDPVVTELELCRPRCSLCGKLPEQRCSCFSFQPDVLRFEPEEIRALLRPRRAS